MCWGSVGEESVGVSVVGARAWEAEASGDTATGDGTVEAGAAGVRKIETVPAGIERDVEAREGTVITGAGTVVERWVGDGVKVTSLAIGVPSPLPTSPPCS